MLTAALALGALPQSPSKPHFPGAHWEERTPESCGLDGRALDRLAQALGGRGCVVKDGYVVKSWGSQSELGDWFSSAKPLLSTLLFFAVKEKLVEGVDARIRDFGWELKPKDQSMTFRHLANMTSGYARPEPPGAAFAYNDFAIQLYQKTLFDRVFKGRPEEIANDPKRFGFLGLEDGLHFKEKNRRVMASVRDWARIGWFWLNQGCWNGTQLLPREFFRRYCKPQVPRSLPISKGDSTDDYLNIGSYGGGSNQIPDTGPGSYGFNWWFNTPGPNTGGLPLWPDAPPDTFASLGARGNCCFMIPSLNLVLVSAFGKWGDAEKQGNANLKLLMEAVRTR